MSTTEFSTGGRAGTFGIGAWSTATILRRSVGKFAAEPDDQVQGCGMHQQSKQIRHKPVIAESFAAQIDLQFLVSILTFAALHVLIVNTATSQAATKARNYTATSPSDSKNRTCGSYSTSMA